MIKRLTLRNFTVFNEADLEFSPGLNVIIGENGTGKTHLLKLAYIFSSAKSTLTKDQNVHSLAKIEHYFSERLNQIFKPDKIGSLTTTGGDGKSKVSATMFENIPVIVGEGIPSQDVYKQGGEHHKQRTHRPRITTEVHPIADSRLTMTSDFDFSFSIRSKTDVVLNDFFIRIQDHEPNAKGVYLPSKEMVSFFEGFLASYENREFQFDETYRDLALHLSATKLKTPPAFIKQGLKTLSADAGGTLKLEGGKFYLVSSGSKSREITLVAEGVRKIATLLHLLENGSLEVGDTLFWDEPESNLNPKLIKDVAAALLFLCQQGIQVVIGTHSLFLLREIEVLTAQKPFKSIPQRYFALGKTDSGVNVQQGDSVDDINPFVMLDEELAQSDRFMDTGND